MTNHDLNNIPTITSSGNNSVYGIADPEKVRYIGQTDQDLKQRIAQGYPHNPEVADLLKGEHKIIVFHEGISAGHADARERLYIAKYGTMLNVGGFNHQTGGKKGYEVIRRDSQPVIATNVKTGEERRFPSVAWASKAIGVQPNHIYEVMNDTRKSIGGYKFRRAEKQ